MRTPMTCLAMLFVVALFARDAPAQTLPPGAEVRLYTLDCGRLDFEDLAPFSDTGEYAGRKGFMVVPCFLIRHERQWLLWDAGLDDRIALLPNGKTELGFHWTVRRTLRAQLMALGLQADDIGYVGLSHVHPDHIGNVGLFPRATVLVSPADLSWAQATPAPPGIDRELLEAILQATKKPVPFDLDVFGDGSVVMLRTAGHTPGHHSLLIRLRNAGPVLLSGDLYHLRRDYDESLIPGENDSRAETLASMERFRKLASVIHARVVIQHAPEDFDAMPAFPGYLD